jgi:two-component system, OmpR family, response regulator ChvI
MSPGERVSGPPSPPATPAPTPGGGRPLVVVDDDGLFLRVFTTNLEQAGYAPVGFTDPAAALAALIDGEPASACVLDLDMPGMDGLVFLRRLRDAGLTLPVVFVTSHPNSTFEEQALADGAADFIDKARGPTIMLYRIGLAVGAQVRDPVPAPPLDVALGPLQLRGAQRRATWRGEDVPLSRTEFDVVLHLAARAGVDVGYREIYDIIKGEGFRAGSGDEGYRANVRAMVKRIRQKFLMHDPAFTALENYPGFGYRWRADG